MITYCDKASHNLALICKPFAAQVIQDMQTAQRNPVYEHGHRSVQAVMHFLSGALAQLGLPLGDPRLPQPAFRFLLLSASASLKPANVWLQRLLKAFAPEMNRLWSRLKFPTGEGLGKPRLRVFSSSAATLRMIHRLSASLSDEQQRM